MTNLQTLLQLKLVYDHNHKGIDAQHVKDMIDKHLAEHYKAIDYSIDNEEITICSHAPIDINLIIDFKKRGRTHSLVRF